VRGRELLQAALVGSAVAWLSCSVHEVVRAATMRALARSASDLDELLELASWPSRAGTAAAVLLLAALAAATAAWLGPSTEDDDEDGDDEIEPEGPDGGLLVPFREIRERPHVLRPFAPKGRA